MHACYLYMSLYGKKTVLSGHLISRLVVAFYSGSCFAVLLSYTHVHVDLNIVFDNTIRKCMEITSGLIQANFIHS